MFGDQNDPQNDNSNAFGAPMMSSSPADNGFGSNNNGPINDIMATPPQNGNGSAPAVPSSDSPGLAAPTSQTSNDLLDIKQQALQHLSPLVSHLDQSPEEKFRTTMMMIQASDDQGLVKEAFEAAKQITDDKARAQAFLDVINEINYFTQHQS